MLIIMMIMHGDHYDDKNNYPDAGVDDNDIVDDDNDNNYGDDDCLG